MVWTACIRRYTEYIVLCILQSIAYYIVIPSEKKKLWFGLHVYVGIYIIHCNIFLLLLPIHFESSDSVLEIPNLDYF